MIRRLSDIGLEDVRLCGGKGSNLGELIRGGFRVPDGFVLTSAAYERLLDESGLRGQVEEAAMRLASDDVAAIEQASQAIRELIERSPWPFDIEAAVRAAYEELGQGDAATPVAVRSSATSEDGHEASFAGQQDSYLGVRGAESVVRHAKLCWSSLYTPRAASYRARRSRESGRHEPASMSVVVQRMVDARVSGVMLTCSPMSGDPSMLVIDASFGLGVAVLNGEVTPDEYWVDKVSMRIVKRRIAGKLACLSDEEVIELSLLGKRVERLYGSSQEIEWAIGHERSSDDVFLLQSRPETVCRRKAASTAVKPAASAIDYVLGALLKGQR